MKKYLLFILIFCFSIINLFAEEEATFIRYPSLNPQGTRIAFCYQGDIWTSDIDGSLPERITIHEAYETYPQWNPEGDYIAFSSDRYGNNDVYIIPSKGGVPERLTYHSSGDQVSNWNGDAGIIFTTNRIYRQIEWDSEIQAVSSEGGTPQRILTALGSQAVVSPDNRYVAFTRGSCRITREQYNGPANKNIWIFDRKNNEYKRITLFNAQDINPQWADAQTLYFLSSNNTGRYNLYRITVNEDQSSPRQITDFTDDGIRSFDVNKDKNIIVLERKTSLYTMDTDGNNIKKIDLKVGTDYRFDPVEHKVYSSDVNDYAVSPNGKYSALVIRGEIFITENHKERKKTVNISNSPWRDINPVWTSDTTLLYLSDREGQYEIYFVTSIDPEETDLLNSLKRKTVRLTETDIDEFALTISPDREKVAFLRGRGTLVVAELSKKPALINKKVLLDGWATPGGLVWSPDSKWLAYSLDDLNFNSEIYVHPADNSLDPVNVSMHPRSDSNPVWSPDGSKIAFTSIRNNLDRDVWFAWLKKSDWEKTEEDWLEAEDESENDKKEKDKKDEEEKEEAEPVKIDLKDIHERLVQVTTLPGDESSIQISKDGKTFYFTAPNPTGEGRDLFTITWEGKDIKQITQGGQNPVQVRFGSKAAYLYYLSKGRLNRQKGGNDDRESIAFSARMTINHKQEREQIFEEAWRTLKYGFYDPEFHGRDWAELKDKYREWALQASTKQDFIDVFNIMLGQVNASHMGLYGRDRADTQQERTGLLGIEIEPAKKGVEIVRIVPDSPADKTFSKLYPGELITAVNGAPLTEGVNFYSYLTNTVDEKILLTVQDKKGNPREVKIRPTSNLRTELYNEWVDTKRSFTEKLSQGKIGYLHIQGMNLQSFERFEREFTAAGSGKEAIVIDVRFNGGGWTTDYLMTVLNVDQHAYTIPRGAADDLDQEHKKFVNKYPYAERLPFYPWMKPSVAICNESSYSNAEIFSHAYKTLDIGTLVGKPTFGAVISTGGKGLIDGSFVRLPFRAWYVKKTRENMEHGPAVPDIIIDNDPGCRAENRDPQLKTAVEHLMEKIK